MTEAEKLRAQKAASTDPERLEWMACVVDAFNDGLEKAAKAIELADKAAADRVRAMKR